MQWLWFFILSLSRCVSVEETGDSSLSTAAHGLRRRLRGSTTAGLGALRVPEGGLRLAVPVAPPPMDEDWLPSLLSSMRALARVSSPTIACLRFVVSSDSSEKVRLVASFPYLYFFFCKAVISRPVSLRKFFG